MKCGHCDIEFHEQKVETQIAFNRPSTLPGTNAAASYYVYGNTCPKCSHANIRIREAAGLHFRTFDVYPGAKKTKIADSSVPDDIARDYVEAQAVLSDSPRASATLSRRCLQGILNGQGYKSSNLAKQIACVLAECDPRKSLPQSLSENIDAIRNFGNFSAHPIVDLETLDILDVENGEAEWCLELVEDLIQHYYVAPDRSAKRRSSLDAKLLASGKPLMQK